MRKLLVIIDKTSKYAGALSAVLCFTLVLVVVYDVVMRYVFDAPTMWAFETAYMIGGTIYVLGFAYTHYLKAHVRVDVFYARLSPRSRALVDVAGGLFLFFPLLLVFMIASFSFMWRAWSIKEVSIVTNWYAPIAPFRTVVVIGFCLFALQGLAQLVRDICMLIRNKPL
jgi:TRAP-type mannitol/chloroaromatic compound transport system permease small subunit